MLFGEESSLLGEFFSSIALKGAMTTALKSETGTVVKNIVLEVDEDIVRCRTLDDHTKESVYLDVSFVPGIPGDMKEMTRVGIPDISLVSSIISTFPKGDTVIFEIDDDQLVIRNSTMSTSVPMVSVSEVIGYQSEMFGLFNLENDPPSIQIEEDDVSVFAVKTTVNVKSMRTIEKFRTVLKTPIVTITVGKDGFFISTSDSKKIRHARIKVEHGDILLYDEKWTKHKVPETTNDYPIGLVPALQELDDATMYARIEGGDLKQVFLTGERNRISKKYVIGPAGRMDDA